VSALPGTPTDAGLQSLQFDVGGMHCAACAGRVQQALANQPGVESAVVNFALSRARVLAVPGAVDPAKLGGALAEAGYELISPDPQRKPRSIVDSADAEADALRSAWIRAAIATVPVAVLGMSGIDAGWSRGLQALLATPVVLGLGWRFHRGAFDRARHLDANMDTLISLGTLTAYVSSGFALWAGGPLFFESAAVIVTLVLLGKSLEARARGRASQSIARLAELSVQDALLLVDGRQVPIDVDALQPGDRVVVAPGARVPVDSEIVSGRSTIDESMLTGESVPVDKEPGDPIYGATVNGTGRLEACVTRVGEETALARIRSAVEEAQTSKASIERLADRVSRIFVPTVLAIAAITALGWLSTGAEWDVALSASVAVLIIACPCAMGLATPTAVMVGSGRGAELGVLFKSAEIFERAHGIDTVVFDKTGTLTRGEMQLSGVECSGDVAEFLHRIGSLEAASNHPIGDAVAAGARERSGELAEVSAVEVVPGSGVRGEVDGVCIVAGKPAWVIESGFPISPDLDAARQRLEARGDTTFLGAWDGAVRGVVSVSDSLRPGAAAAVAELEAMGATVSMISGDARAPAERAAHEAGIEDVIAEALPSDKRQALVDLQARGRRVAFVGDGINDAPALAQADLGIAVGSGTEIAAETGDVVLLSGDPRLVPQALRLARRTFRTISQNLFWAFAYNTAAIPAAAFGLLDPMVAAGAMALSSVSVVLNSLRLRRFSP
jgi:cation-transporting ATPase V